MYARPLRLHDEAPALHPANRRRHGRLRLAQVQSSLGEVVDIAPEGMRIRCRGRSSVRVGEKISMTLATPLGLLAMDAVVVWSRRLSTRHSEIGLAVVDMTDDVRKGIVAIAQGCADGNRPD